MLDRIDRKLYNRQVNNNSNYSHPSIKKLVKLAAPRVEEVCCLTQCLTDVLESALVGSASLQAKVTA